MRVADGQEGGEDQRTCERRRRERREREQIIGEKSEKKLHRIEAEGSTMHTCHVCT